MGGCNIRNWRTNHKLETLSHAREGGRWVRKAGGSLPRKVGDLTRLLTRRSNSDSVISE